MGRHQMGIDNLRLHQFSLQVNSQPYRYRIYNWLALNQKNFKEYIALTTDEARKAYLERKLTGNILSFASGIGWYIKEKVTTSIIGDFQTSTVHFKGHKSIAFHLDFNANVFLPNYIGLGKGVSKGYGVVKTRK